MTYQIKTPLDKWQTNLTKIYNTLEHEKQQLKKYKTNTLKADYYKSVILPSKLRSLKQKGSQTFRLPGKQFKKIFRAKYNTVLQLYFPNHINELKNKLILFKHARIGKLLQLIHVNQKQPQKNILITKDIIHQVYTKNLKKNPSMSYIAITGYMHIPTNQLENAYQECSIININQLTDDTRVIKINYQPLFDESEINQYLLTKGFSAQLADKLYKRVFMRKQFQQDIHQFKNNIKKYDYENSEIGLYNLCCAMQLEFVNEFIRQKSGYEYLNNIAIVQGQKICRSIVIGCLSSLIKEQQDDDYDSDDEQTTQQQFYNFFDGLFNDNQEEKDIILQICATIHNIKTKQQLTLQQILIEHWGKSL